MTGESSGAVGAAAITGSINAVAPAWRVVPAAPPRTYLSIAYNMLPGVQLLASANPQVPLALCLLSAHVLECALKAYLSRNGSDEVVKGRELRHDLVRLWQLAHVQGLGVAAEPPEWARMLGYLHGAPYYLRYSTGVHGIVSPPPEPMATELTQLLGIVERSL